jgi:hypothetical protein
MIAIELLAVSLQQSSAPKWIPEPSLYGLVFCDFLVTDGF